MKSKLYKVILNKICFLFAIPLGLIVSGCSMSSSFSTFLNSSSSSLTISAPPSVTTFTVLVTGNCDRSLSDPVILTGNFTNTPLTLACDSNSHFSTNISLLGSTTTITASQGSLTDQAIVNFVGMVTVWDIDAINLALSLPLPPGFNYNFEVNWGDGSPLSTVTSNTDPDILHTYPAPGVYTVMIRGLVQAWDSEVFSSVGSSCRLLRVDELGDMGWLSLKNAFRECSNLTTVRGGNTSQVADMSGMFSSSTFATPDTSTWDTSNVTDMSAMFYGALNANPDTSGWDTSNVTNMSEMFYAAIVATPDTSGWDTSKVTNMSWMFYAAYVANPDTSGWDTSNVTDMSWMFSYTYDANPDTSGWDTSNVANMASMFIGARVANPDTSDWNTSNVIYMVWMFNDALVANPDTSGWNTGNVIDMAGMFYGANVANPDTSGWDTSNVIYMSRMFSGAVNATPDTSGWDTSKVTNMTNMFNGALAANPDTSGWDTGNVTDMSGMFNGALVANPDTSGWNTGNVIDMSAMFRNAINANPVALNWNLNRLGTGMGSAVEIFTNSNLSNLNYSNFLIRASATNNIPVALGAIPAAYQPSAAAARADLLSQGWSFTDEGAE